MTILVADALLLSLACAAHMVIWRIHQPRCQIVALVLIFAATPLLAMLPGHFWLAKFTAWQTVQWLLLYASSACVYIILYSLIEGGSPSLLIIDIVARCGNEGCKEDEIRQRFGSDDIARRIALLMQSGMIAHRNDMYHLTSKGRGWSLVFEHAARIIGLRMGG